MDSFDFRMITLDDVVQGTLWLDEIDKLEGTIEEKLDVAVTAIECPTEYLQLFEELIKVIEMQLQKRFRKSRVKAYGFGSFLTGLALKNCDLDLYVEFDPPLGPDEKTMKVMRSQFYSHQYADVFNKILLINAKVPILRCDHVIGFQCDVSVSNPLARHNSQLIKFYLSLSEKFRSFFLLVKLWVKRIGLLGASNFKSYTLALLMIYYLQQKELLPSVLSLQTHPKSPPPREVAGWDSSFLADKSCFSSIGEKKLSLLQLLTDFFIFYSEFEFGFYIISPFLGGKILKPFKDPNCCFKLYHEKRCKFNDECYVCVQDVFQHDFNPASNISKQGMMDFQAQCKTAATVCKAILTDSRKCVLKNIFWCKGKENSSKGQRKRKRVDSRNGLVLCVTKFPVEGRTEESQRRTWVASTLQAVEHVLTRVALVEVRRKADGIFECECSYPACYTNLRKEVGSKLNTPPGPELPLERQEAISAAIKELPGRIDPPVRLNVKYSVSERPTRLHFEITESDAPRKASTFDFFISFGKHVFHWISLSSS